MQKTLLIILGLSFFLISPELSGQKVKYKKGQIFVDKKLKYEFVEINKDDRKGDLKHYALKDIEGNSILTLTDTMFYYTQLPNETAKRMAYETYVCTMPGEGLSSVMNYYPIMNYPKQRIKDLDKVGFFKNQDFDESVFNSFIEKQYPKGVEERLAEIELDNKAREENYNLTEKKFGALLERSPAKTAVIINTNDPKGFIIKEGKGLLVGKFKLMNKGSNNHAYAIMNKEGVKIGEANVFQTPVTSGGLQKYRYNLKPFILGEGTSEDNFKWFYERVQKMGGPKSTRHRLEKIAVYMVNNGLI